MLLASTDLETFRRHFQRHIMAPIGMLIIAVVLVAAFGLYWTTSTSNAVSVEQQAQITKLGLTTSADQLSYEQQVIGRWDQRPRRLAEQPASGTWYNAQVSAWASRMFKHDISFFVDAGNLPFYGYESGSSIGQPRLDRLATELKPMIASVRSQARARYPGGLSPATAPESPTELTQQDTVYESYVTLVDGRPAAASAMLFGSGVSADAAEVPVIVSVRFLDGTFLREMAEWSMIDSPRYSRLPSVKSDEAMVPFVDGQGQTVGYIIWKPDLPGSRILKILGPMFAALVLVMVGVMGLLLRSLWRSGYGLASAMIDLSASEAQAQHLAFHDVLTGLPNRALFQDRLEQAMAPARRGEHCAILVLDLDRFKQVNDTMGHTAGDMLIRQFAARLSKIVRGADTVARIGGDEFTILLSEIHDSKGVNRLCQRILASVREPFDLLGSKVYVGVSIGVALAPEAGTDRGDVMRKADIALYRAKSEGKDCYRIFTPTMDETIKLRSELELGLRHALDSHTELEVFYQPEVDAVSGKIVGLEALLRWQHPTRGTMLPQEFVSIAEDTGLISAIGEHVLAQACRVARNCPGLFIAVNLSPVQFRSTDLAARLIAITREAGCDPCQIELEITESVLLDENVNARDILAELREAGFRIALDDFGTGYSSLSYLRDFKVDKIKIDRSFTQNLGHDAEANAIVASVVTLGHAMGLTVSAEGVENSAQRQLLSLAGCNELQGFLFARAMPESEILGFIANNADNPKLRGAA